MKMLLCGMKRFLWMLIAVGLLTFVLSGCSSSEKKQVSEKYEESDAFIKVNNKVYKLADTTLKFYIDSSVKGEYLTATNYAIAKANAVTTKITFKSGGNSASKYKVTYSSKSGDGLYALTSRVTNSNNQRIGATITYYSSMNILGLDMKKHIAIHEFGHVFGLADLKNEEVKSESIMYYSPSGKYIFPDYTEFDKHNIIWAYGS